MLNFTEVFHFTLAMLYCFADVLYVTCFKCSSPLLKRSMCWQSVLLCIVSPSCCVRVSGGVVSKGKKNLYEREVNLGIENGRQGKLN